MKWTILGAEGFIGSALCQYLKSKNQNVLEITRKNIFKNHESLGNAIYCIGLTADFRTKPHQTIDAHAALLSKVLQEYTFDSFLYLSSTRLYSNDLGDFDLKENQFVVNPANPSDLYNISKLLGEAICLQMPSSKIRIARLSNVVGKVVQINSLNFLDNIVHDAIKFGQISLRTTIDSEKDFIHIDDLTKIIVKIVLHGNDRIYNLASGENVSNLQIVNGLQNLVPLSVDFSKDAVKWSFPPINVKSLIREFNFTPQKFSDWFPSFLNESMVAINRNSMRSDNEL